MIHANDPQRHNRVAATQGRPSGLVALAMAGLLALAACGERELILPGERLDPRALAIAGEQAEGAAQGQNAALSIPGARANAEWTQRGGNARHDAGHAALGSGLSRMWSTPIGQADSRRYRITADPVVGGGRIFTMDSRARVSALTPQGQVAWSADLTPGAERADSVSGGGLAYEAGRVYATTGFGEIVAMDASSGGVLWRQRIESPVGGAPTVADGVVYVRGRDSSAWAVRTSDGRVEWRGEGTPGRAGVMGVAAPAVTNRIAIYPYASGEVAAVLRDGGVPLWSAYVAGARNGRAYAAFSDLTGEPVIRGNRVYVGNSAGRMAAFDLTDGSTLWTAPEGAMSPVAVVGGSVFAVNDQNQLVRLDAANGGRIWAVDLPLFTTDRAKKQKAIYPSYGPVLAGGRLFVSSGDGLLRAFDPASGVMTGSVEIPGGAASAPVVAGGVLYVVSKNGQLNAYR